MVYVIYGRMPDSVNEICLAIVPSSDVLTGIISSLINKGCAITDVKSYSKIRKQIRRTRKTHILRGN